MLNKLLASISTLIIATNTFADCYTKATINTAMHITGPAPNSHPLKTLSGPTARMVIFTTYDGYKPANTILTAPWIWASTEPELRQLCKQYTNQNRNTITHDSLTLWLAQMLGLPTTNASKRRFVMLNVPVIQAYYGNSYNKIGIFRPCTDPRIGPHTDGTAICPAQMNSEDSAITSDFKTWFINNSIAAYRFDSGGPWTEYGYTYNWNPEATDHYGVSEFIILKNTPITILPSPYDSSSAYITPEQYCS